MLKGEYEVMRSVEDRLWWYRGLRDHVINALGPTTPNFKLLDAGCGTGGMLALLRQKFPNAMLTGIDASERALELTRARDTGATLLQGSTAELPFADAEFDYALSLDVLITRGLDDRRAVAELHRVLRPRGKLIVNVAAFDFLRGSHDVATAMGRRYTRARLARVLAGAGFRDYRMTYWNMSLLPAVALVRWASRRKVGHVRSDLKPLWPPANALLTALVKTELAISRIVPLPFGTSLFAVATK